MNAFDYFFEYTSNLDKKFLVGKEEITFKELYAQSVVLADQLKSEIGEGGNVLLLSPNNVFFMVVYLGVIKSGNTVVPLDPMIEEENFAYIRELSEATRIFAVPAVKMRLKLADDEVVTGLGFDTSTSSTATQQTVVSHQAEVVVSQREAYGFQPEASFDRERIAEIIFTSGSTGKPKGVMLSHKNLVANTASIVEYLKLTEDDRMLVVLPFYYCYGLSLLHTHLRVGGSIVFNNAFIFIGAVINDLRNHGCTGFAGVPSHFQILLRKSDSFRTTRLPSLKYVTQAGGKLATVFIDEFREAHPEVDFIVMYGQTEATARLSYLPLELYEERKGSIGKGIPGVELRVVNEIGEIVQPGETGEVIAKGENVMPGYYKDKEGTAEALRNGWLYTGDLGTVDSEGFIYLTARSKEIIKVGGKRISPKEIEAVILSINSVVDCSISSVEDELLGEALKATVVRNAGAVLLTEEIIREHCAKHLAIFKVPQVIEIKDHLEFSPTGKKIKK
jgi:acyl-CoA synthetase (AMP-forming)/AMP-acid ligase II